MRAIFLIFLLSFLLSGCFLFKKKTATPDPVKVSALLSQPFPYEATMANFKDAIQNPVITEEIFPNTHYPEQDDTLYAIQYKRSVIKLLHTAEKKLLVLAEIRDPQIALNNGVHVGMSLEEVNARYTHFTLPKDQKKITYRSEDGFANIVFEFDGNDKLKAFHYESLVD